MKSNQKSTDQHGKAEQHDTSAKPDRAGNAHASDKHQSGQHTQSAPGRSGESVHRSDDAKKSSSEHDQKR